MFLKLEAENLEIFEAIPNLACYKGFNTPRFKQQPIANVFKADGQAVFELLRATAQCAGSFQPSQVRVEVDVFL